MRGTSIAATILGAGLGALGLVLWLDAPDPDAVDAGARAHLNVRPNGLELTVPF